MNLGMNSMTSKASWKSVDAVSDQFPAGLRVLVVDDDPTCLRILERMLKSCHYEVTKCSRAELALKYLKDNKDGFDIVISDVHMPDMDGFKLLELIGLDMDLPVIMMSADDSKNVVMKGVEAGACDYLIKPVRMEALKNIWQHVVRKKRHEWKEKDLEQSGSVDDGERQQKPSDDGDYSSSANEGNWKGSRKRKDEEDEGEDKDDSSTLKKQRVVWSTELHKQFVAAVNQLGIDKAVPKKILELMNVPGLTRENVASHLQKYRLYLRRLSGQPQNGLNSFMGPGDPAFVGLDHLQSLRATNKSFVDQRNIFSFESPNMRFLDGQQPLNNGKHMNPLHGIPINSKQFATLHPSVQPYGNVHVGLHTQSGQSNSQLAQMVQPQPRTHMFNEVGNSTTTNLPSSVVQPPFTPYGIENVHTSTYTSLSQPSSVLEFPRSSCFTSKGLLQEELSSEMKGSRSFLPNSDVFNDLSQNRTEDWSLQNVGTTFGTPTQSRVDVVPSVLVQPEFSDLRSRLIRNASINKAAFSAAPTLGNNTSIEQQLASSQGDNSLRVKAERLPEMGFQNNIFADQFGQEDLMTALFKQQEGVVAVENEFGFDEYQLDDLPV